MPITWRINGDTASLVPFRQTWIDNIVGVDLMGAPVLSAFKDCRLDFEATTYASYQQWAQYANTGTSISSAQVLNLDGTSATAFSGIYVRMDDRPSFETGNVNAWSIILTRCRF